MTLSHKTRCDRFMSLPASVRMAACFDVNDLDEIPHEVVYMDSATVSEEEQQRYNDRLRSIMRGAGCKPHRKDWQND